MRVNETEKKREKGKTSNTCNERSTTEHTLQEISESIDRLPALVKGKKKKGNCI